MKIKYLHVFLHKRALETGIQFLLTILTPFHVNKLEYTLTFVTLVTTCLTLNEVFLINTGNRENCVYLVG